MNEAKAKLAEAGRWGPTTRAGKNNKCVIISFFNQLPRLLFFFPMLKLPFPLVLAIEITNI